MTTDDVDVSDTGDGAMSEGRFWATFVATVGLSLLVVATLFVAAWLYFQWTTPDCGLCDDASSSVSRAPG